MTAAADPAGSDPLGELAWLAGCWRTHAGAEECWLAPRGGLMLGLHRAVRQGRPTFFEYLRIERDADAVSYVASPKGQATTAFRMVEASDHHVVFENPEHDFPTRIRYERVGDALTATISGERQGELVSSSWSYTRFANGLTEVPE